MENTMSMLGNPVNEMDFEEDVVVARDHKDKLFRFYFMDKRRLLSLYNALNGTSYTDPEALEVNTLKNAIFISMKNDISFIIDSEMCLYEHQSTLCPNMPLRGLFYFAKLYQKIVSEREMSSPIRIIVPTPKYVVFYNGKEKNDKEFVQYLSDSFEKKEDACMEVEVRHINVNYDTHHELLERCKEIEDYAYFIHEIRRNAERFPIEEAVSRAIEHCIEQGVMKEFLIEHRAEVASMSIEHFNMEVFVKDSREVGYEEGEKAGFERGFEQGIEQGIEQTRKVMLAKFLQSGGTPEQAMIMFGVTQEELNIALN